MPHDANGTQLQVGDKVALKGVVKSIDSEQPTYCNITFAADKGMEPAQDGGQYNICLSARMVEKVEDSPLAVGGDREFERLN